MNISSTAAFHIIPNLTVYAASKSFVNAFSEGLDAELKRDGVRVLAACPGKVATGFSTRASRGNPPPEDALVMTAQFAADEIWLQIVSKETIHIFDWRYRLATYMSYLFPGSLKAKIAASFMKQK